MADKQEPQMIALKDGRFYLAELAIDPHYLYFELARHLKATKPLAQDLRLVDTFPLLERQFVDEGFNAHFEFKAQLEGFDPFDLRQMQIANVLDNIVVAAKQEAIKAGVPYFLVHVLEVYEQEPVRLGAALIAEISHAKKQQTKTMMALEQLVSAMEGIPEPTPRAFSLQPTVNLYAKQEAQPAGLGRFELPV